jgi:hypothetical protein
MEYPSIIVNKLQIRVAPIWYLLDKGFELKVGDAVSVSAAPAALASDPYLYALEITNVTTKLRIALRDSNGVPLWSGGPNGARGNGPMAVGGCLDPGTIVSAAGTVDKISMGAGIQMPTLTLKTADGKLLVLKLGPERILLAADFEVKPGDSGVTLQLGGNDCAPAWN